MAHLLNTLLITSFFDVLIVIKQIERATLQKKIDPV